jgi:predicted outer membrane repeat protein
LFLSESIISGNQATGTGTFGGGVYAAGNLDLSESIISGNSASSAGGIYAIGNISLNRSTVQFNAANSGGGVASLNNVTVLDSTIHGNVATTGGGAIHAIGDVTLFESTISGNHSEGGLGPGAGGIFTNGNVSITRSTITNNRSAQTSPTAGGVLQLNASGGVSLTIDGSIVAGNAALVGDVDIAHDLDGELAVNFSLIGTGVVPTSGGNNIVSNNPQLGPLTHNGGLTETHLPQEGSPVLNAGDPNILFEPGDFDQRGDPFLRIAFGRIDMGAVEVQDLAPALLGDYNMNGVVDGADYVVWRKSLGNGVPNYSGADGNGDGTVDQNDHNVWRAHFAQGLSTGAGGGSGASRALGASSAERATEGPPPSRPDGKPRAEPGAKSSERDALQAMVPGGTQVNFSFGPRAPAAQASARGSVAGGGWKFASWSSIGSAETRDGATRRNLAEISKDAALVAWLASRGREAHVRRNEHGRVDDVADADAGNYACTESFELADVALTALFERTV